MFTIVRKSLNYNTLQLLAQLPYKAFSEGGEGVGIGDCKPTSQGNIGHLRALGTLPANGFTGRIII